MSIHAIKRNEQSSSVMCSIMFAFGFIVLPNPRRLLGGSYPDETIARRQPGSTSRGVSAALLMWFGFFSMVVAWPWPFRVTQKLSIGRQPLPVCVDKYGRTTCRLYSTRLQRSCAAQQVSPSESAFYPCYPAQDRDRQA